MSRKLLEICVEKPVDIDTALAGGADRLELCGALALGGLTPSVALAELAVRRAHERGRTVRAMVRPRDGDFAYDAVDMALARAEGEALIATGVDGLVFGAAREGRLDEVALRDWCEAMRSCRTDIGLTLHRAVDLLDDPVEAVDMAVANGFDHILTSGGAVKAADALPVLAAMQARAAGRIVIMVGSGVRAGNARQILDATGVTALHASAGEEVGTVDPRALAMGFALGNARQTSLAQVVGLREVMDA